MAKMVRVKLRAYIVRKVGEEEEQEASDKFRTGNEIIIIKCYMYMARTLRRRFTWTTYNSTYFFSYTYAKLPV